VLVLGLSLFAKWSRLGLSLRGGRRSAGRTGSRRPSAAWAVVWALPDSRAWSPGLLWGARGSACSSRFLVVLKPCRC
jgi:branched-chain amino acid transport system permease protein